MQVAISENRSGTYKITPLTEDEVIICDVSSYCSNFSSYEEAEACCVQNGWEIEQ